MRDMVITHDAEWNLVLRLADVGNNLSQAFLTKNTGIIATAALDIARKFSVFYTECSVLKAPDEEIRNSRIALCISTRQVLVNLLSILGIEAPERM